MITCGTFGAGGRLGNQLFHLGLLFAVAARNQYRFGLRRGGEQLWECFDLEVDEPSEEPTHVFEETGGTCNFEPLVFDQPDGTVFHGYYQSYRYYERCRPSLTSFLRFKPRHLERARDEAKRLRSTYHLPLVSVHYRRADYLDPWAVDSWGNLHADGYYDRVFERLGDDLVYVVFSDDMAWCREHVHCRCAVFADLDPYSSLCLMTLCDVNVVANSTFSWWGAFLNQTGQAVFAPSRWYGPAMKSPNDRQFDIVPPQWVEVETFAVR